MKPPPFLVGAALLFWGWQSGMLPVGAVMALVFESGRWVKSRWDLSNDDFTRIWVFCTFLFLAASIFAFTSNEGPADFRGLLQNPSYLSQRNAGAATARTAASLFRWLPMLFFLFAAAQSYSTREGVPLDTISLIMRRRWKKAREAGRPLSGRTVNISYFYFGLCLFSASIHPSETNSYFWGLTALLAWALWSIRSRRFPLPVWGLCFGSAVALGYFGQQGIGHLQNYLGGLNPTWLASFGHRRFDPTLSRTDFGRIGRIKSSAKVVIRLESQTETPPPLLREASYRTFKGQTWYSEYSEKDYLSVLEETNRGTWVLLRDKTNTVRVNIGCYLEGGKALLPVPPGVARFENLTAFTLSRSPLGALLEEGPGLVVFDAYYGSGSTIDSPPETNEDLAVPARETKALDQVIEEIGLTDQPPQAAIKLVAAFFAEKFKYSTYQPLPARSRTNDSPLSRFLLRTRSGHCEYFATAGTLLLRRAGIPARYAAGYAVHESVGEGKFVVRARDAHAWCLAWDEKRGLWRDVDFTPPTWIEREAGALSLWQKISDVWSRIGFELSRFRWGQTHLRQYLLWGVVPVLVVLLIQIVRTSRKRRRRAESAGAGERVAWPGLDSEFYELEKRLAALGITRLPAETLFDWLQRAVQEPGLSELKLPLRNLVRLHYRYRFDPVGLTSSEREALREEVTSLLDRLEERPALAVRG